MFVVALSEIRKVLSHLLERGLVDIIIYGSMIDTFSDELSDMDILVIHEEGFREYPKISTFFLEKYEKIDISFYPVGYVEKEYDRGNPFFGQCIINGISVFNSETVMRLRSKNFKITQYTYEYETKRLNQLVKRIRNVLSSDNEEAIRLISRFAKLAIITFITKKRNRIVSLKTELERLAELREILEIITCRKKYIKRPRKYLEKILEKLTPYLEKDIAEKLMQTLQ
ncbi:MAG: hypothetical protein DRN68_04885 [Thaumarchaeota archaeon]|nr:MAG: hypothetical protein DRN68_04885 [Nitrososphaerota archaeon]